MSHTELLHTELRDCPVTKGHLLKTSAVLLPRVPSDKRALSQNLCCLTVLRTIPVTSCPHFLLSACHGVTAEVQLVHKQHYTSVPAAETCGFPDSLSFTLLTWCFFFSSSPFLSHQHILWDCGSRSVSRHLEDLNQKGEGSYPEWASCLVSTTRWLFPTQTPSCSIEKPQTSLKLLAGKCGQVQTAPAVSKLQFDPNGVVWGIAVGCGGCQSQQQCFPQAVLSILPLQLRAMGTAL